jgi:transcriptional regulator with XRE-family HTH domain
MAEASTTELTVTPKELGKHLRTVRRKKGLSLSEVARGAGLSRRELVAYERGKVPIPESDLWVLAGSCGVDVAELVPSTTSQELVLAAAPATSILDTVAQLRRNHEDPGITPYLGTLHKLQALPPGKRIPVKERELDAIAVALGGTPASVEEKLQEVLHVSPDEAQRLRAMIMAPPGGRGKPRAIAAAPAPVPEPPMASPAALPDPAPAPAAAFAEPTFPETPPIPTPLASPTYEEPVQTLPVAPAPFLDTPFDAASGNNVDVFEELARLPEPLPLGDPAAPVPDLLAPPTGTFDDTFATSPFAPANVGAAPEGAVELVESAPGGLATPVAFGLAADAPPIDVAMRQGSDRWDVSGPPVTPRAPEPEPAWETNGWQPPEPPGAETGGPVAFWEGTDDWTPTEHDDATPDAYVDGAPAVTETEIVGGTDEPAAQTPWVSDWEPAPWGSAEPVEARADTDPWTADEWPRELAGDEGPWEHEPDPEAVSTGFYVDWGTPDTEPTPPDAPELPAPAWDAAPQPTWDAAPQPAWDTVDRADTVDAFEATATHADTPLDQPADVEDPEPQPAWDTVDTYADTVTHADTPLDPPADVEDPVEDVLPPISWRADARALPAPVEIEPVATDEQAETFEPEPIETFVTAGPDWQLGNALPLVEVRGQGALVMRRADERWALADVTTAPDFVVEVDVDFRSGPGLGVLFRADTDDAGRMSGYSFDIDPIYDGGGYLVRQWQSDRELWNPIARVGAADPTSMYGPLTVRLEVTGDHLAALVNGVEVLTVENLKQASADRGREAANGDRVGVQAWSSSDLVIDTLRVAEH